MKNKFIYTAIALFTAGWLSSCVDFLDPENDNDTDEAYVKSNPAYAEGLLLKAYRDLPGEYDFTLEAGTDDAVTNNFSLPVWEMANGQWTSQQNPVSAWNLYTQIFYINYFMKIKNEVTWDFDSQRAHQLNLKRLTGESFGLRAWYLFNLLRAHAGPGPDGSMLGVPIITQALTINDNWQVPRSTFDECVRQIISDCDSAIASLPADYVDVAGDYDYNMAMGARWTNRFTGNVAKALKSRVLLYAASPAFNTAADLAKWETAAVTAGNYLNDHGGVSAISPTGLSFWVYPAGGPTNADVIWSRSISTSYSLEGKYFPPSLYGDAEVNPSQNLVNAFPMANGYPVSHALSGYDPENPYSGRDPRLEKFIICNGSVFGAKGVISTHTTAPVNGINIQTNSTRTGYYIRKFLMDNVVLYPTATGATHFYTYIRFTEILLNYAEAANEAWGPDNDASIGISARQAISAIRQRAGINQPDNYLASIASKEEMRTLIRNERRIELCFEGHRFYDIRRWNDKVTMKTAVSGVKITAGAPATYEYFVVEPRNYQDHMIYGPIPYSETLKYSSLYQNQGW
jgi:hypothetical protein